MAQRAAGPVPERVSGVAQATPVAVSALPGRGLTTRWWAVALVLVALGAGAGLWSSAVLEQRLSLGLAGLPERWRDHQRSLEELSGQLTGVQLQAERWAAAEEAAVPPNGTAVVVIPRDQAAQLAGQLRSAVSQMETLRRSAVQAHSEAAGLPGSLRNELLAVVWAALAGLVVAQLAAGAWLARGTLAPVGRLRRELDMADQSLQALTTALPQWFVRVAASVHQCMQRVQAWRSELETVQVRLEGVGSATGRLQDQSRNLARSAEQFSAVADRVRELGNESRWLALSTSLEAARVEPHGRPLAVVADEIRRMAAESRQMSAEAGRLQRDVLQQADQAAGAAQVAFHAVRRLQEELENLARASREAMGELERLHERLTAASKAAAGGPRLGGWRGTHDLRASVDRALSDAAPAAAEMAARQTAAAAEAGGGAAGRPPAGGGLPDPAPPPSSPSPDSPAANP
ncbi:MAG TPA: methyl-accepting chemotaxis protein [Limnochordales bacterium]